MHIPDTMLQGSVCPITAALSVAGLAAATYSAMKSKDKPTSARFGAIAALIFAGQMMNFPVQYGTSGHLIGGVLASVLLGTPFGILAIALVVSIQCLVFADGGLFVLGANIFNMAIIGAGLGGILRNRMINNVNAKSWKDYSILGFTAWLSVVMAALVCSIELSISGTIPFDKVIGSMLSSHALIGIGEGIITVSFYAVLTSRSLSVSNNRNVYVPLTAAGIIGLTLSPFASGFPDGLEWVAAKYQFLHESAPVFVSPLSDYSVSIVTNEIVATGIAGLTGVFLTFAIAWLSSQMIINSRKKQSA